MHWGQAGADEIARKEREDAEKVDEVEITYIDPANGSVCRRQVFCDPEDWQDRYQARLLVSSELVNSLTEASGIWFQRFRGIHRRLEDSRIGYYYELWNLRKLVQKLTDYEVSQQAKVATQAKEELIPDVEKRLDLEKKVYEVCPVHFFMPDLYLDCWTREMLRKATASYREELKAEIHSINEKIHLMGGGTWRQILGYFIKRGEDPMTMARGLLDAIEDPLYRREIINTMTNGLQDLYDELVLKLEVIQVEASDRTKREMDMRLLEQKQREEMIKLRKQMAKDREELEQPGFEEPPEEDDKEEVAAAQAVMFEKKDETMKLMMMELRKLKAAFQEQQAQMEKDCDPEATQKLEEELAELERRAKSHRLRTEKFVESQERTNERIEKIDEKVAAQAELQDALRQKLSKISNVNPAALKLKKLEREMKELQREEKKVKASMAEPNNRIKAMRVQLRVLYKKLGWDWDQSDSEDESDGKEKPYWQRRKLAVNGFLPFNQSDFLFAEQVHHSRRTVAYSNTMKLDQKSQILEQMKAKRQQVGAANKTPRSLILAGDEDHVTLFGADDQSRDPIDPVQRAITAARERLAAMPGGDARDSRAETPCWQRAQREQERASRQAELDRLLLLRESFEGQLQQCVECFVDLLPQSGSLGDLRSRLSDTLVKLRRLPEDPQNWQAQELERELEDTCTTLQYMIEEAITYGDEVNPISAAMMHSVKFSELRTRLSEVLQSEHEMRHALQAVGSRPREFPQQSESLPPSPSGLGPASPSSGSSPRLRGQTAPGGSNDDGSEGGISTLVVEAPLKLPPHLMAQTSPLFCGGKQSKKDTRKKVDFGFRPDGGGEESVENWSLFKVSKGSTSTSGFGDSISTGLGLTTTSGFLGDKMRKTETKLRRQRAAVDCDFHEYMSQTRQMSQGAWNTASAPSLSKSESAFFAQEKKKHCPNLPKLVHSKSLMNNTAAAGFPAKGDMLGSWAKSPPQTTLRKSTSVTVPASYFRSTAPVNAFAKW